VIVTAVERRRGRLDVYVDGELACTIDRDLAAERDVRPGRTFIAAELIALEQEAARRAAIASALRLLSYRPRSERELRQRLMRNKLPKRAVDAAVARMRELGYLDDAAFARFYAETRQATRPSSQRLLRVELRQRGIEQEAAEVATEDISDEAAAYEAASRRVRALAGLEYEKFRERLGAFLTRRGFSYGVARSTIERCWAELSEQRGAGAD
jgi:regulatory protein